MPLIRPFLGSAKYYATAGEGTVVDTELTIPATAFVDDGGNAVEAFPANFAYYNLYINAQIQTGDVSQLDTAQIVINDGDQLNSNDTIVVELVFNM